MKLEEETEAEEGRAAEDTETVVGITAGAEIRGASTIATGANVPDGGGARIAGAA